MATMATTETTATMATMATATSAKTEIEIEIEIDAKATTRRLSGPSDPTAGYCDGSETARKRGGGRWGDGQGVEGGGGRLRW
jgi:hypothetical protein